MSSWLSQVVERGTVTAGLQSVTLGPLITAVCQGMCRPTLGSHEQDQTHGVETDLEPIQNGFLIRFKFDICLTFRLTILFAFSAAQYGSVRFVSY